MKCINFKNNSKNKIKDNTHMYIMFEKKAM